MLLWTHLHVEGLLDAVGQVFEYVLFQSAKHEWEYLLAEAQQGVLVVVALDRTRVTAVEIVQTAKHRWVEETEERVKLRQIVLHRRTAQCQSVLGMEHEGGLGGLRGGVLDVLALVENHIVELLLGVGLDVVAHDGVGGQYHLVLHRLIDVSVAGIIGIDRELWGELLQLVLPVEEQAARHYDERRFLHLRIDEGEDTDGLHGLTETHVVGETASQVVVVEIFYPFDSLCLVWAQLGFQLWCLEGFLGKVVEALVHLAVMLERLALQRLVDEVFYLRQVEERHLDLSVLVLFLEDAFQTAHVSVLDDGTVAVRQLDVFLLVVLRENLLERELFAFERDAGVALQEVDAR